MGLFHLIYHGNDKAPVVRKANNTIHRINCYPNLADSIACFVNTYLLNSDLSSAGKALSNL